MAEGIKVVSVDERPAISRSGKPVNEVVLAVETDQGASGSLVLTQRDYAELAAEPEKLSMVLIAKRDELDAAFMA